MIVDLSAILWQFSSKKSGFIGSWAREVGSIVTGLPVAVSTKTVDSSRGTEYISGRMGVPCFCSNREELYFMKSLLMKLSISALVASAEFKLLKMVTGFGNKSGVMPLYSPVSNIAMVAKANPAMINNTGKIYSTNKVILFLNYILSFFLVILSVWSKKLEVSPCSKE